MNKIFHIALREYTATAMTKGFIIGALVVPAIIVAVIPLIIVLMMKAKAPEVSGTVAVLDRSGRVLETIREKLAPESLAAEQREAMRQAAEVITDKAGEMGGEAMGDQASGAMAMAAGAVPKPPRFTVEALGEDSDIEAEKQKLTVGGVRDGGLLSVVIVAEDAVMKPGDAEDFGSYELFIRPKLDDRVIDDIRRGITRSIRETRIKANGFDPVQLDRLTTVGAPTTKEVTAGGERASNEAFQMFVPLAAMILLITSVMVGGQYLVTTTVEEKSSRVVEVLLSAVSPMQLMTGKVVGQMFVGLTLLVIYSGLGIGALIWQARLDLIDPMVLVYFAVFFLIAYFLIASSLAAVGSAVNELREAQSLQTPVMLAVMLPYFLWMPISRDPNSVLSVVLSLVPPMSPFVMMLRLTSTEPPPTWQVWLAIGIGVVAVYFMLWATAKIFRVGLLMYGKPPNFRTLIRWVRMA